MNQPASLNRTLRTTFVVCLLLIAALWHSGLQAQAVLDPGQFTGRVNVGSRTILYGSFQATSTLPVGFSASSSLNGTWYNGTNLSGPFDPSGYTLSAQALDPVSGNPIVYDIAGSIATSLGPNDTDFVVFPIAHGNTVAPNLWSPLDLVYPNPGILTVEVVNMGPCQSATFTPYVYATLDVPGSGAYSGSYDSTPTTSSPEGLPSRTMDFPILDGLGTYSVYADVYLTGATESLITTSTLTVTGSGPGGIIAAGDQLTRRLEINPVCACTTGSLSGNVTLNCLNPQDSFNFNYVYRNYYLQGDYFYVPDYSFIGLGAGRYRPHAATVYNDPLASPTILRSDFDWPWSAIKDGTGQQLPLDAGAPYKDIACDGGCACEQATVNYIADAAYLEGNISFGDCFQNLQVTLVKTQSTYATGLDPIDSGSGLPTGSYGGYGHAWTNPSTGHYRQILPSGTWNMSSHTSDLRSPNPPDPPDPAFPEALNENLFIGDARVSAATPDDLKALHLIGCQPPTKRDFSYQMGKYTVTFKINGGPGDGSKLRNPRLSYSGPYGTPEYTVYASGTGEVFNLDGNGDPTLPPDPITGNGDYGRVVLYLPKGEYGFKPYATRALDNSDASFPDVHVLTDCGVDTRCDLSCPSLSWTPQANTCPPLTGMISGTALDSDGVASIEYRVVPGSFTSLLSGGTNTDQPFNGDLTLQQGENIVELKVVDGQGHVYDEARPVYTDSGVDPVLSWDPGSPPNNLLTDQPSVAVSGSASASVQIDFIKINGNPDFDSSNKLTRTFSNNHRELSLVPGANLITVEVCDVCGRCATEQRTVIYNRPPVCGASTVAACPSVPGEQRAIHLSAAASTDPDLNALTYSWTTTCPNAAFDDTQGAVSALATPTLTVGLQDTCPSTCSVSLTVTDSWGASSTVCTLPLPIGTNSPPGLVGWWPGDGDAHDIARGNDGTPNHATIIAGGNGLVGDAFTLNGSTDFVVLPDAPELDFGPVASGGSDLSISAWVKTTLNATSGVQVIYDKRNVASYQGYEVFLYQNRLGVQLASGGSYTNYLSPVVSALTPNCWHHVAVSLDRDSMTGGVFYVDGNSVLLAAFDASAYDGDLSNSSGPRIGASLDPTFGLQAFSGQIDELQIFNTTLQQSDIQAIVAARSFGQCRCVAPPSGLVSWWTGDGTASDIQGGNDGTLQNGATYVSGPGAMVGQAFQFNGSTDYVLVPDSKSLDPGRGSFSIDAWVNPDPTGATQQAIVAKYECGGLVCGGALSKYALYVRSDGRAQWEIRDTDAGGPSDASGGEAIFGGPDLRIGGPHLVVGTRDIGSQTMNLYVDGVRVAGQGMGGEDPFGAGASGELKNDDQEADPLLIGASTDDVPPDFTTYHYKGAIDEVEYFNKALTPAEVKAMHAARGRGKCKPGCDPRPPGMVSWWSADGHASDIQGGNDGTLEGGVTFTAGPNAHIGQAFNFNGTAYVRVPHSPDLEPGPGSFSVDAWVYARTTSGNQTVIEKYDCGGDCSGSPQSSVYLLSLVNGAPRFQIRDTTPYPGQCNSQNPRACGQIISDPGGALSADWHYLVATRDIPDPMNPTGGTINLYVDGQLVVWEYLNDQNGEGEITDNGPELDPLTIGAARQSGVNNPPLNYFDGFIDEVEYFNRALSPSEVLDMYNAGSRGKCKPQSCADLDGDGYGSPASLTCSKGGQHGDCAPNDVHTWAVPGEVTNVFWPQSDPTMLTWDPLAVGDRGGDSVVYDVLRSTISSDFVHISGNLNGTDCVVYDYTPTSLTDPTSPPNGESFFYLVRAKNGCPTSDWNLGVDRNGVVRPGRVCP